MSAGAEKFLPRSRFRKFLDVTSSCDLQRLWDFRQAVAGQGRGRRSALSSFIRTCIYRINVPADVFLRGADSDYATRGRTRSFTTVRLHRINGKFLSRRDGENEEKARYIGYYRKTNFSYSRRRIGARLFIISEAGFLRCLGSSSTFFFFLPRALRYPGNRKLVKV